MGLIKMGLFGNKKLRDPVGMSNLLVIVGGSRSDIDPVYRAVRPEIDATLTGHDWTINPDLAETNKAGTTLITYTAQTQRRTTYTIQYHCSFPITSGDSTFVSVSINTCGNSALPNDDQVTINKALDAASINLGSTGLQVVSHISLNRP